MKAMLLQANQVEPQIEQRPVNDERQQRIEDVIATLGANYRTLRGFRVGK